MDELTMTRYVLENTYLKATQALTFLATNEEPKIGLKLEDKDFQRISEVAANKNAGCATVLLSTLSYTFFQIKIMGFTWEEISWHPEIEGLY
jgi:hypothetical protein